MNFFILYNVTIFKSKQVIKLNISEFKIETVVGETIGEVIDYGVKLSGAPLEWQESMGDGINIGIIDTGIDSSHPDLSARIKKTVNFCGEGSRDASDDNGHGTHVAGIIAASKNNSGVIGTAPLANLYIAKAFDKNGRGNDDAVVRSIDWMIANNVNIINMSFSSSDFTPSYYNAVKAAYDKDIIIVCAAGNNGLHSHDTLGYPAKFDETISVAAVDINNRIASFSSKGVKTDIAAAGYEILSCYPGGGFARLSGTSMAAPIISGCAAILNGKAKSRIGRLLTPEEMRLIMCMYAENIGKQNSRSGCGLFSFGRLQLSRRTMINEFLNGLKKV